MEVIGNSWKVGGDGLSKTKTFKEMYQVGISKGVGVGGLEKKTFRGGGMDIFFSSEKISEGILNFRSSYFVKTLL